MPVDPCECTDASIVDRLGVVVQLLLVDFLVDLPVEVETGLGADGEIAPNFVAMRALAEWVSWSCGQARPNDAEAFLPRFYQNSATTLAPISGPWA